MKQTLPTVTKKKENVKARSDKMDPNNTDPKQTIHLKKKGKKLISDDGFEHRTSKETTDPLLPG